jgi:hypothetical protein
MERYYLNLAAPLDKAAFVVVELLRIWPKGLRRRDEKLNQEQILRDLLARLEALGMEVGWLVTAITDAKGNKLKVGAVLPLSATALGLAPQVAADLMAKLLWMGLDKTNVNVSVRFGTDGVLEKDHERGKEIVASLEGGEPFAKNFTDRNKKAGSWRIKPENLPSASSEYRKVFEAAVAARNAPVVVQTPPPTAPAEEPVASLPKCLQVSWADRDDEEPDYSLLPSRQEPVTPAKEESEALTPVAPKKKNRRGTRGKGRAC